MEKVGRAGAHPTPGEYLQELARETDAQPGQL